MMEWTEYVRSMEWAEYGRSAPPSVVTGDMTLLSVGVNTINSNIDDRTITISKEHVSSEHSFSSLTTL